MPAAKDERGVVVLFADEDFCGCCVADDDDDGAVVESLMAEIDRTIG